jgi:hypothetical protein
MSEMRAICNGYGFRENALKCAAWQDREIKVRRQKQQIPDCFTHKLAKKINKPPLCATAVLLISFGLASTIQSAVVSLPVFGFTAAGPLTGDTTCILGGWVTTPGLQTFVL